jgi:hypothetical protein
MLKVMLDIGKTAFEGLRVQNSRLGPCGCCKDDGNSLDYLSPAYAGHHVLPSHIKRICLRTSIHYSPSSTGQTQRLTS